MDTTLPPAPPAEPMLRVVRIVAPLAAAAMALSVGIGLATAPSGAAAELFANVWGRVTIIDLYLAFAAVWVWIAWRERSVAKSILWAVLITVTGSVAIWSYVAWRAGQAHDMGELLLGPSDIGG